MIDRSSRTAPQESEQADAVTDIPRIIVFDPDGYRIDDEYRLLLEAHAGRLRADPAARVRIEGHADGQGSRAYQQALADKRADVVRKALLALGAAPYQLHAVGHVEPRTRAGPPSVAIASQRRRVVLVDE
ncbi:MAG TPA: OmpA family protein [Burkholderiaceae bacterium]|nr:OmpA family protein [Burkholderiaceae bacterium]